MKVSPAAAILLAACGLGMALEQTGKPQSSVSSVTSQLKQARQLRDKGLLREAQEVYFSLLPQLRAAGDQANLAGALNALSLLDSALGEYGDAADFAQEAAKIYRRLGDEVLQASALNNVGRAQTYAGDYTAALDHLQRALALHRSHHNLENEITTELNIGSVFYYQGRYLEALRAYQSALEKANQVSGEKGGPRVRLIAVTNLAMLLQRLGRNQSALDLYLRLRQSPQALLPSEEGQMLANLGALYRSIGDPIKALETYRAAQKCFAREQNLDSQIGVLKNIGLALGQDLEDYPGAIRAFTAALQLAEQSSNRREEMALRLYRGEVFDRINRLDGAREEFETALAQAGKLGATEEQWRALYGLGRLAMRLGHKQAARDYLEQAIAVLELLRSRLQLSSLKAEFLANKRDVYDSLIELLLEDFKAPAESEGSGKQAALERVFDLVERARARAFLDQLSDNVQTPYPRENRELTRRLRGLKARMAHIWSRQLRAEGNEAAELRSQLAQLENEYLRVENQLQKSAPQDQLSSNGRAPSAGAIQSHLDDATAMLIYWVGKRRSAVLWITRSGIGVGERTLRQEDVGQILFLSLMEEKFPGSGEAWRTLAVSLGESLLAGVRPLEDPRIRHLVIVPDGVLSFLPFGMLGIARAAARPHRGLAASGLNDRSSVALLIERFDICYLPAAALWLRDFRVRKTWGFPWKRELLAFGDPDVPAGPEGAAPEMVRGDESWSRLPKSADELASIARLVNGRATLYTRGGALKKHLLEGDARGVPLLHFSTHARVDAGRPERSRLLFSPGGGEPPYLFLGEIYSLDLRGVDLVTLSACETERGKMIRGEGVASFSRAFLAAGARATVTSLWRVDDEPTAELMKQYYYFLNQGMPKAEALRQAKLAFLSPASAVAHPRYWAAFVLTGDGLSPAPVPLSWMVFVSTASAVLLLLGSLALWLRSKLSPRTAEGTASGKPG